MRFRFKRRERRLAKALAAWLRGGLWLSGRVLGAVVSWMRSRFTLILLPPDHRPPRQFSFSAGKCVFSGLVMLAATISLPSLRSEAASAEQRAALATASFGKVMTGSDTLRDEVVKLASVSEPLITALEKIDERLRGGNASAVQRSTTAIFAPFIFAAQRRTDRSDYGKLVALRSTLEESTDLLLEAGTTLRNLRETTEAMPLLWPLKGGIGHVSMLFGYNPNPFTGVPYLHMGLDLGNYRTGDPVVASGDGVVLAAYFDVYSGYGNNVIIGHEHGFYTRYAHLRSFSVRANQKIRQGDVIGIVGETGRVDAPHLHYEVRLGPEILDPQPFIVYKTLPRRLGPTH